MHYSQKLLETLVGTQMISKEVVAAAVAVVGSPLLMKALLMSLLTLSETSHLFLMWSFPLLLLLLLPQLV